MIGQVALITFFTGLFLGAIWGEHVTEKRLTKKKKGFDRKDQIRVG